MTNEEVFFRKLRYGIGAIGDTSSRMMFLSDRKCEFQPELVPLRAIFDIKLTLIFAQYALARAKIPPHLWVQGVLLAAKTIGTDCDTIDRIVRKLPGYVALQSDLQLRHALQRFSDNDEIGDKCVA